MGRDNRPTERVLEAMENPYVDCIGHLTGRKITTRAPMDVDVERVIAKALETGTFLEINSQPDRLDLSAENARLAHAAGVMIAVSTDAHSTREFGTVSNGIDQARRAGLDKKSVLNCLPWKALAPLFHR